MMKEYLKAFIIGAMLGTFVGMLLPERKTITPPALPAEITPAPSTNSPPTVHAEPAEDSLERWMRHMEIWKCDDGTYELRTDRDLYGKYMTVTDARINKTNWAKRAAILSKELESRPPDEPEQRLPDCGKRVE